MQRINDSHSGYRDSVPVALSKVRDIIFLTGEAKHTSDSLPQNPLCDCCYSSLFDGWLISLAQILEDTAQSFGLCKLTNFGKLILSELRKSSI